MSAFCFTLKIRAFSCCCVWHETGALRSEAKVEMFGKGQTGSVFSLVLFFQQRSQIMHMKLAACLPFIYTKWYFVKQNLRTFEHFHEKVRPQTLLQILVRYFRLQKIVLFVVKAVSGRLHFHYTACVMCTRLHFVCCFEHSVLEQFRILLSAKPLQKARLKVHFSSQRKIHLSALKRLQAFIMLTKYSI